MKTLKTMALAISVAVSLLAAGGSQAQSFSLDTTAQPSAQLIYVANGCGPGGYRGPYGSCHRYGRGPYPGGYYGPHPNAWKWNGCSRGSWRGPWGHCRDTPYHGRLPNGGWK